MRVVQVPKPRAPHQLVDRPMPEPGSREVRIKVEACGICHSDSFTMDGTFPGIPYPIVPGHEIAGRIDAVGPEVTTWSVGQRVGVGWFGDNCGVCPPCRRGDFIHCRVLKVPGINDRHRAGAGQEGARAQARRASLYRQPDRRCRQSTERARRR